MILFPFHTDTPCEPHYSSRMGSCDQGHEAALLHRSLPQQFIEMLHALLYGTRVNYLYLAQYRITQ